MYKGLVLINDCSETIIHKLFKNLDIDNNNLYMPRDKYEFEESTKNYRVITDINTFNSYSEDIKARFSVILASTYIERFNRGNIC